MGFFRTVDEALDYGYDYLNVDSTQTEAPTEAATEVPTEAPTEAVTEGTATQATDGTDTAAPSADAAGCASVVGTATIAVWAVAACMFLRKRR